MNQKTSLIVTSISAPNPVMKSLAEGSAKNNIEFIVIGDVKSPSDFNLKDCTFHSIDSQKKLPFSLANSLPVRHYARKNLGYLLASKQDVIIETDDDNFPREDFWNNRTKEISCDTISGNGWTNVYSLFSKEKIWPRGFPLENIHSQQNHKIESKKIIAPIQQGLADENPDVDAVYRMCMQLPLNFEKRNPVALGKGSWCPFNSQNTTWFKESFPLLYLPSYCSFRMTDIWRSFVAQRIAWTCDWSLLFHNSTVWQERNEHSLIKDFEDEVPGYLNNSKICRMLEDLDLRSGQKNIMENLERCYRMLVEEKFIGSEELPLVNSWISDFEK